MTQDRKEPNVKHALELTSALLSNNLQLVFQLYVSAPNLERALVDHVLDEIRYKAARLFTRSTRCISLGPLASRAVEAFRVTESVESLIEELGFYSSDLGGDEMKSTEIPPGCMEAVYRGRANIQVSNVFAELQFLTAVILR